MIIDALSRDLVSAVQSLGSVGQADLGPLADLADGLITETASSLPTTKASRWKPPFYLLEDDIGVLRQALTGQSSLLGLVRHMAKVERLVVSLGPAP